MCVPCVAAIWRSMACSDVVRFEQYQHFLGRAPNLENDHEIELKEFLFGLREQGMGVTTQMIMIKACSISRLFRENSKDAQYSQVKKFLNWNALISRFATHESQNDSLKTYAEALDFVHTQRPKLISPGRDESSTWTRLHFPSLSIINVLWMWLGQEQETSGNPPVTSRGQHLLSLCPHPAKSSNLC